MLFTPPALLWVLLFRCHAMELHTGYSVSISISLRLVFVITTCGTLWVLQFCCVILWSLPSPVYCEYFSLVVWCYGSYTLLYVVSTSVSCVMVDFLHCPVVWVVQVSCDMLCYLNHPVYCEYICLGVMLWTYTLGTIWVFQSICVILWILQPLIDCEYINLVVSCYGPYTFRYIVSTF